MMTKIIRILPLLLGVFILSACATVQPAPDAPRIVEFRVSPDSAQIGDEVEFIFHYENIRGGLKRAKVILDFQGSLPNHTRKTSSFAQSIPILGDGSERGVFRSKFRLAPSDPPPFDIFYYLKIVDTEGRESNEATTKVKFRKL